MTQTIKEKIKQRRRQMLVHSYLYYELDESIISDAQWSKWAMELVQLQKDYPEEASQVEFADMFSDWDGSSGAFLNYNNAIIETAERLLYLHNHPKFTKLKNSDDSKIRGKSEIKTKKRINAKRLF